MIPYVYRDGILKILIFNPQYFNQLFPSTYTNNIPSEMNACASAFPRNVFSKGPESREKPG